MSEAKLIQVIQTTLERRGAGTVADPVRRLVQYWDPETARLLAEDDCHLGSALEQSRRVAELSQRLERVNALLLEANDRSARQAKEIVDLKNPLIVHVPGPTKKARRRS